MRIAQMRWRRLLTLSDIILDPLRGRTPLWKVTWLYSFGGSIAYSALGMLIPSGSSATLRLFTIGGLVLTILQLVALWQCAYNCRSRFVGNFVRASVVVSFLLLPLAIYVMFKYPELLTL
jgi:hypothetical protein